MGCGCSRRTTSTSTSPSTYRVTLPSGETKEVLTQYEAQREVRLAGGGTIVRAA